MASREVSGTDELLSHMIDAGEIEQPGLVTFNQWQTWRAGPGRRPNKRVDGAASSLQANVSALWRATMAANYGDDWVSRLLDKRCYRRSENSALRSFILLLYIGIINLIFHFRI